MKQMLETGVIENAVFVPSVEVVGKEQDQSMRIKMSAIFPDLKEINKKFPGATYISYPTGTAAYAFLKAVLKIKSPGVFPPEALDENIRRGVFLNLKRKGIIINQQSQKK